MYVHAYVCRSMRRAQDVREQLEGLMSRVEIEMTSNPLDDIAIRKVCAHICTYAHKEISMCICASHLLSVYQ